ncbi:sialidase-1 [Arthrobacter sp. B2I5]|uniref:sialidase family protein n=1 Tax=Arthrobacter sp. B2I5 TaxID=3042266 RepID=UPI002787EE75|nr:sialidase family protein [Arthrobacter sp. B2I5]MDQ0826027.1 sialidase-1 [Arthrobacter sp. B2I5]
MTSYLSASIASAHPSVEQVLAVRGYAGYRQYRIPALAVTVRGTLLAAYDGRPNLDDLPSPIDLLLRRSMDSGQTWGAQQVVRTGSGLDGFGDPSLLVDAETNRVFLFHAAGTRAGFFESTTGLDPEDEFIQHCDLSYSDDDGMTWQHRRITAQLKGSDAAARQITGIFAAAGQGIQIHAGPYRGRLVQQFVVLRGGRIMAASAYSDDHGDTWRLGKLIEGTADGGAPNENKVAALADGRLLLHSRATPRRLAAFSDDGGHSWSSLVPVEDLPDPSDNGSLTRFDGLPSVPNLAMPATDSWLLATNNHDANLRRNTVLSLSPDNGATWPAKLVLCEGSSAYSTATRLPDGNIGVLYERQGYREIVFVSVPPGQLTGQLPPATFPAAVSDGGLPPSVPGLTFDMELRSITPGLPAVWQNAGEFHVMAPGGEGWGAESWKEIGQGYSPDQVQVLGTREAQDLNYGPIIPGYKAGDILAFTGRVLNEGPEAAATVRLSGPGADAFPVADLLAGEEALYFTPTYTVTEEDVEQNAFTVTYELSGLCGSSPWRSSRIFRFDVITGEVSVQDDMTARP